MSIFELYFTLGLQHIADLKGYDHILFILTLCVVYRLTEWKKVLVLITAFTIGHSLTLALATLGLVRIDGDLIEFLIPLTIFLTALANVLTNQKKVTRTLHYLKYTAALFFGLIHGLGFSNYLRSLLGSEKSMVLPLFSFNVGIEAGQILIVALIMLVTMLVVDLMKYQRHNWHLLLSGAGLGVSLVLMIERFPY
ncbi:MAG: HupE/UreJ family protein [Bacteroidetes bacterium]|nr:HupE/UreJ family protein [Bacteroidota bacterium]